MERSGQGLIAAPAWVRDAVFVAGGALTIGLLGPYGSWDEPLQPRIVRSFAFGFGAYWMWPLMRLILRVSSRAKVPLLFAMVAGLIVVALPVATTSYLIGRLFDPGGSRPALIALYFPVLAMILPLGLAYLYVDHWIEHARALPREGTPAPSAQPRLYARMPANLGRDIVALQAEDHYVRVHTRSGSTLLLMRLADAIAELDGQEGLRVHRSWWVAAGAVVGARLEGRRAVLSLVNGVEAPVTREAVPEIRRAGWL